MSITFTEFVDMILPSEAEAIMNEYFDLKGQYVKKNAKGALKELFTSLYDDEYNKGYITSEDLDDYMSLIGEDTQQGIEEYIAEELAYAEEEAQR